MQGSRLAVEGKTSLCFTEKKMEKRANSLFPELYSYAYTRTWCPSVAFRQVIAQCVQTHARTYALMHLEECPVQPIVSLLAREQRKRRNFVVVFFGISAFNGFQNTHVHATQNTRSELIIRLAQIMHVRICQLVFSRENSNLKKLYLCTSITV